MTTSIKIEANCYVAGLVNGRVVYGSRAEREKFATGREAMQFHTDYADQIPKDARYAN